MKKLLFLLFLLFIPISSALYFGDSYNFNDDFETTTIINSTFWHNYTGSAGVGGYGYTDVQSSTDDYFRIMGGQNGDSTYGSGFAVARTKTNYKTSDGIIYRIDFNITAGPVVNGLAKIEFSDGTLIDATSATTVSPTGVVTLETATTGAYYIIINGDSAILYNLAGTQLASATLSSLSSYYLQFRASIYNNNVPRSNYIYINNFTSSYFDYGVTLNTPANGTSVLPTSDTTFNATVHLEQNARLMNATLFIWNGTTVHNRTAVALNGTWNSTVWIVDNFVLGKTYDWNVYYCAVSSIRQCGWANTNRSFYSGFQINSNTYNSTVYDTSRQSFVLNISGTSDVTFAAATFIYNGTVYSANKTTYGSSFVFSANLDIPVVSSSSIKNHYWNVTITYPTGTLTYSTASATQTVNPATFTQCGTMSRYVNYTIYEEENNTITPVNFDATFSYKLYSLGTVVKNASVDLMGSGSYAFCANNNETYYIDASISLSATGYSNRKYTLGNEIYTNATTSRALYILNSTTGSDIILEIKDEGLTPLSGYLMKIFRIQPSTGNKILVEEDIANTFGQVYARLVENTVDYDIEIYDGNNTLVKTILNTNVLCKAAICVIPLVVKEELNPFERFEDDESLSYEVTYDNETDTFSVSWLDSSGDSPSFRFLVERVGFDGTTTVCNNVSSAISSSLTCSVGSATASYRVQFFKTVGGIERRIYLLNQKINDLTDTFGLEGFMWSFLLLFTLLAFGLWSPVVGVVLYVVGYLFLGLTGIVFIDPALAIAQIVIGALFVWAVRT